MLFRVFFFSYRFFFLFDCLFGFLLFSLCSSRQPCFFSPPPFSGLDIATLLCFFSSLLFHLPFFSIVAHSQSVFTKTQRTGCSADSKGIHLLCVQSKSSRTHPPTHTHTLLRSSHNFFFFSFFFFCKVCVYRSMTSAPPESPLRCR